MIKDLYCFTVLQVFDGNENVDYNGQCNCLEMNWLCKITYCVIQFGLK